MREGVAEEEMPMNKRVIRGAVETGAAAERMMVVEYLQRYAVKIADASVRGNIMNLAYAIEHKLHGAALVEAWAREVRE